MVLNSEDRELDVFLSAFQVGDPGSAKALRLEIGTRPEAFSASRTAQLSTSIFEAIENRLQLESEKISSSETPFSDVELDPDDLDEMFS